MDEDDLALRNLTYARFVEFGRAPTAAEVAAVADRDRADVVGARAGRDDLRAEAERTGSCLVGGSSLR